MWLTSRWSVITKWIITILIGIVPLAILGSTSYNGYKYVNFQRNYSPVLGVQQALDIYGLKNGKYPKNLDELVPDYVKEVPKDKNIEYKPSTDLKTYTMKANVLGEEVELHPAFTSTTGSSGTPTSTVPSS